MSWVTNVILSHSCSDDPGFFPEGQTPVEAVNGWLSRQDRHPLRAVDRRTFATGKVLECCLHIGAYNYLALADFLDAVAQAPWTVPEEVQVLIKEEDDVLFRMYTLGGDRRWAVAGAGRVPPSDPSAPGA